MGFTVPGSNAGGGFGLGGIAGGLGALLQGLVQGHQMKLQNQEAQQRIQGEQTNNSINVFDTLSRLGQSDPALLQNPQFAAALQKNIGTGGIPLPTNPQGGLDTQAFLPSATSLLGNPQALAAWSRQPLAVRQLAIKNYGGSEEDKQQLLNLPVEASDSQVNGALADINRITNQATIQGVPITGPLLEQYNRDRQIVGMEPIMDASQAPQIGAKSQAQIGSLNAGIDEKRAQTAKIKLYNKYFPGKTEAQIAQIEANTGLSLARAAAIPAETTAKIINANAHAEQAHDATQRLGMDIAAFKKLGTTPAAVNAYHGLASQISTTANQYRVAAQGAQRAIGDLLKADSSASDPVAPGTTASANQVIYAKLKKQADDAQAKFEDYSRQNKAFTDGFSKFASDVLHKGGAPNSWVVPQDMLHDQKFDKAWSVVSGMSKADALKTIGQASSLSGREKAVLIQRVNASAGP